MDFYELLMRKSFCAVVAPALEARIVYFTRSQADAFIDGRIGARGKQLHYRLAFQARRASAFHSLTLQGRACRSSAKLNFHAKSKSFIPVRLPGMGCHSGVGTLHDVFGRHHHPTSVDVGPAASLPAAKLRNRLECRIDCDSFGQSNIQRLPALLRTQHQSHQHNQSLLSATPLRAARCLPAPRLVPDFYSNAQE